MDEPLIVLSQHEDSDISREAFYVRRSLLGHFSSIFLDFSVDNILTADSLEDYQIQSTCRRTSSHSYHLEKCESVTKHT